MAKILIIDDSASMRQMVTFTLQDAGHDVVEAEDGRDGLAKLTDDAAMVITDLNMPNMNGIDFIREVRNGSVNSFVPIIMLTTESEDAKKNEGKEAGATGWIVKPFTPEKLVDTVQKLI
jgi:two-component system, chemotaxis family, chemotaxis protein CheY